MSHSRGKRGSEDRHTRWVCVGEQYDLFLNKALNVDSGLSGLVSGNLNMIV